MTRQPKYWAAKDLREAAIQFIKRKDNYYQFLKASGIYTLLGRSYQTYFRATQHRGGLLTAGEREELTDVAVNHYRSILQSMLVTTISQRPAFQPNATNTDVKSMAQTILANGILEYYLKEKQLERHVKLAAEKALFQAEGFLTYGWNSSLGPNYAVNPETGQPVKEGDIEYKSFGPLDIIRDPRRRDWTGNSWLVVRDWANRWDLAAKHPEYADKLEALSPEGGQDLFDSTWRRNVIDDKDADEVPIYYAWHKKSDALPDGRAMVFCSVDTVLLDGPLPYRNIPVLRIAPGELDGTSFGYTVGYDMLPVQAVYDALTSTIASNQATFGVQNILVPNGHDLSVAQLGSGMNLVGYDPKLGKPEAMNLTSTPQEIFAFRQENVRDMETISGVNSVSRGNPDSSLKSGSALALVQSMTIQFLSGFQQSYAQLLEDVGTETIKVLRDFAKAPRIAMIAGKANRSYMKWFTGDDLDQIDRVTVEVGSALSHTQAGRVGIADTLIQGGHVDAKQYLAIIQTGKLEPVIEGGQAQIMLVRDENEKLQDGKSCIVLETDDHEMHISEHGVVLASTDSRNDPNVVKATLDHIQQHKSFLMPPPPLPGAMDGTMPPAPGQMDGTAPPAPGSPSGTMNPGAIDPSMPNPPRMPTNPMTGEQAPPPGSLPQ